MQEAGGLSIGLLPENNIENANQYVGIPLATGVGLARNYIIATSSLCLVAVGGKYGTLSEIAYGLQLGKKVFAIHSGLEVDQLVHCDTVDSIIENVCKAVLSFAGIQE